MEGCYLSQECTTCKYSKDEFVIKLMELLGPVILKAKPLEILSYSKLSKDYNKSIEKIQEVFKECKRMKYMIIPFKDSGCKVLFFNEIKLHEVLTNKNNMRFLIKMGYPKEYTLEGYLDVLCKKIESGIIPDEIGVFLGYPLKDVIGFMGHPSLKLTKINGWRVYGDSLLSDITYDNFKKAKDNIRYLLSSRNVSDILVTL